MYFSRKVKFGETFVNDPLKIKTNFLPISGPLSPLSPPCWPPRQPISTLHTTERKKTGAARKTNLTKFLSLNKSSGRPPPEPLGHGRSNPAGFLAPWPSGPRRRNLVHPSAGTGSRRGRTRPSSMLERQQQQKRATNGPADRRIHLLLLLLPALNWFLGGSSSLLLNTHEDPVFVANAGRRETTWRENANGEIFSWKGGHKMRESGGRVHSSERWGRKVGEPSGERSGLVL